MAHIGRWSVVLGLMVLGVAQTGNAKEEDKKDKASAETHKVHMKVWRVLDGAKKEIDGCTARYVEEYPKAKGTARVSTTVQKDGRVSKASVSTSLEGARNLRACLEKIARGWRFPEPQAESADFSFELVVQKGVKFSLLKPGEKPKDRPKEGKGDQGFIKFVGRWLPPGWK